MKLRLTSAFIAILWVGMILALSMESVVKFTTPTLGKAIGFDEGRTVFSAFNKVQLLLLFGLILCSIFGKFRNFDRLLVIGVCVILFAQIFWLFPSLSQQVDLLLHGVEPPSSFMHSLYGILEFCKLSILFALGVELVQTYPR